MLILLSSLFVLVAVLLCLVILFLQGKGDLGVIGAWQSGQVVFGGSGGQDFIAKMVWFLGFLFLALSFVLAKLEVKYRVRTVLTDYGISKQAKEVETIDPLTSDEAAGS